jgi:hypothetical protein
VRVALTENISLASARSEIWNIIKNLGTGKNYANKVRGLQLPIWFRNTRHRNFTVGIIEKLPKVKCLDLDSEQAAMHLLAAALNQHYCLRLYSTRRYPFSAAGIALAAKRVR